MLTILTPGTTSLARMYPIDPTSWGTTRVSRAGGMARGALSANALIDPEPSHGLALEFEYDLVELGARGGSGRLVEGHELATGASGRLAEERAPQVSTRDVLQRACGRHDDDQWLVRSAQHRHGNGEHDGADQRRDGDLGESF
jgi:hypothetical protein